MTVCHLLLGRPWQFDRGVIHNGRTNHYSFKMKGKEFVLRPMSPSQVLADKKATHRGENSERANHQKESERHKPKLSASTMSDKKNLVLFATKREMREVCENPSSVLHYVLLCKDEEPKTNTSCYLLSTALDFREEERMMQQSSVSISLSFSEPRYQSSRRLHASPLHLHKNNNSSQPTRLGVVNPFMVTYESEI